MSIDLFHGDCLEIMENIIPDNSIDMILCDLPYGTTDNKWDIPIPFSALWNNYKKLIKEKGCIILTAKQPFTTDLINSNREWFRYELVWDKTKGGNFLLANKMPMQSHENILIFYQKLPIYNPQKIKRGNPRKKGGSSLSNNFVPASGIITESFNNEYHPTSILTFSTGSRKDHSHPTQKPLALFEWLIKSYTNESMTILDNCMGSGTTGVACKKLNRNFIGIEKDETYFKIAEKRINETQI